MHHHFIMHAASQSSATSRYTNSLSSFHETNPLTTSPGRRPANYHPHTARLGARFQVSDVKTPCGLLGPLVTPALKFCCCLCRLLQPCVCMCGHQVRRTLVAMPRMQGPLPDGMGKQVDTPFSAHHLPLFPSIQTAGLNKVMQQLKMTTSVTANPAQLGGSRR